MKAVELREMTLDELTQMVKELKRKQFNLRVQRATGELDNTAELKKTRQETARVMTVAAAKARRTTG